MKLRKDHKGFSVIEVLLVLILIAIVVFIGYYIYHNQKASKTSGATTSATASSKANTQYAVISEWGVKVPETASTGKITYASNDPYESNPKDITSFQFFDGELYKVFETGAASGCTAYPPVSITVFKYQNGSSDLANQESDSTSADSKFVPIGNYTYQITSPQSTEGSITDGSKVCYTSGNGFTQADAALNNLANALADLKPQS